MISVFIAIVLFFCLPYLFLLSSKQTSDFFYRNLRLKEIADSLQRDHHHDLDKAQAIYRFVEKNITQPKPDDEIIDIHPIEVLNLGYGSCDQQAHLMVLLGEQMNINGHIVFLKGYDSISHHSVAELYIDERWMMFDPFYKVNFLEKQMKLGVADLCLQPNLIYHTTLIDSLTYAKLFQTTFPFQIFEPKPLQRKVKIALKLIFLHESIFGALFSNPWKKCYHARFE